MSQTNAHCKPKNEQIKQTSQETSHRRQQMVCRTYELKVDTSKLSKQALRHLKQLFLEAKWYSNDIIASKDSFAYDSKGKTVQVKVGNTYEARTMEHLSSQMKQGLLNQIHQDIRSLAKKKAKGQPVGQLKFKKVVGTIPLKQPNNTYTLQRPNKIRIQGLRRWIKVRGMVQIPPDAEVANSKLIQRHGDFYVHVTTYLPRSSARPSLVPPKSTGIDGGIAHQLPLANGVQITYTIPIPARIKRLYRTLSRKRYGSKNYVKTLQQLRRAFAHWTHQKQDVSNKLVSILTSQYQSICFQDDPLKNWQRLWGTRLLNTALGACFTALEDRAVTPIVVGPWTATTRRCSQCGFVLPQSVPLTQRIFVCPECHFVLSRDWNAARCIEQVGLLTLRPRNDSHLVPTERREVTPSEMVSSTSPLVDLVRQIPFVSVQDLSMNKEAPLLSSVSWRLSRRGGGSSP
ncbi:MAG: RNA-guided endonuclease InsQ/TnpB family protein [Candidatus Hermodarchaeota archaeon]